MSDYILIYEINDYPDFGGGMFCETFGLDESKMHERVNELAKEYGKIFDIRIAGFLQKEIKYEPASVIVKYIPKEQ